MTMLDGPLRQWLTQVARDWWLFVLRGVLAVLFGIIAWAWPDLTLTWLIFLFGAYAIVDGVFAVANAIIDDRETGRTRLMQALGGLLSIAFGILVWAWPDLTATTLMILIGFWAIVAGVALIVTAIRYRREIENEWSLGLSGLASLVFGVIITIFPGDGAIALTWLIGLYAIIFGAFLIAFGWRLRGLRDQLRSGPTAV